MVLPSVGEHVTTRSFSGICRFAGPTQFASGDWIGLELATPDGKNDGSVAGVRYFTCEPLHGVFVRPATLVSANSVVASEQQKTQSPAARIVRPGSVTGTGGATPSIETPLGLGITDIDAGRAASPSDYGSPRGRSSGRGWVQRSPNIGRSGAASPSPGALNRPETNRRTSSRTARRSLANADSPSRDLKHSTPVLSRTNTNNARHTVQQQQLRAPRSPALYSVKTTAGSSRAVNTASGASSGSGGASAHVVRDSGVSHTSEHGRALSSAFEDEEESVHDGDDESVVLSVGSALPRASSPSKSRSETSTLLTGHGQRQSRASSPSKDQSQGHSRTSSLVFLPHGNFKEGSTAEDTTATSQLAEKLLLKETELADVTTALKLRDSELRELKAQLQHREAEISEITTELECLRAQKIDANDQQRQIQLMQDKVHELESSKTLWNKARDALKARIESLDRDKKSLQGQVESLRHEVHALKRFLGEKEVEIEQAIIDREISNEQNKIFELDLSEARSQVEQLEKKVLHLKSVGIFPHNTSKKATENGSTEDLSAQYETLKYALSKLYSDSRKEIKLLQQSVSDAEKEVGRLANVQRKRTYFLPICFVATVLLTPKIVSANVL